MPISRPPASMPTCAAIHQFVRKGTTLAGAELFDAGVLRHVAA